MVLGVRVLSGVPVRVIRAEGESQQFGQIRCLSRAGAGSQNGDSDKA
jgi:hypothetical protein